MGDPTFWTKDGYTPRIGRIAWAILLPIAAVILLIALMVSWPLAKVPKDQIGLSYGGGLFEGAHFQGIHQPGSGMFFNGWGDKLYLYPVTQRNYIISSRPGEGDIGQADSVQAASKDAVQIHFEVATYFKLNTNKIQKFHEQIGLKYHAYENDGWDKMLNDSFRQQIENSLQEEARSYGVADLYNNKEVLLKIQDDIGRVLKDRVTSVLGDEYFCGPTFHEGGGGCPDFTFVIKRVTIPKEVQDAFEKNRTSLIEVQTKQNEIAQAQAQAQAIRELNAALNTAGDQYVQLQQIEALNAAIKSGQVKFWVIPGSAGVTLTTPTP